MAGLHCRNVPAILLVALLLCQISLCDETSPPVNLNPIANFCARWYHQSTVMGDFLYIDGGLQTYVHDAEGTDTHWYNTTNDTVIGQNNYLIAVDLSVSWDWRTNISQVLIPRQPVESSGTKSPVKIRGALYSGPVRGHKIYRFGGSAQYENVSNPDWWIQPGVGQPDSPQYSLWSYDTSTETWEQYDVTDACPQPPSSGAYADAPDQGLAFSFNGQMDNGSSVETLDLTNKQVFLPGLVVIDTATGTATNLSTEQVVGNQPRSRGSLSYVAGVGSSGILLAIGGSYKSGDDYDSLDTPNYVPMDRIDIFDISSFYRNENKWYRQKTSGHIPAPRVEFCAVAVSTPDNATHNIYIYGGRGPGDVYYDDVYVLSLPSFTWTQVFGPGASPRYGHTCHLAGSRTMLTVGGITPEGLKGTAACDWEYRSVGLLDMTTMVWGSVWNPHLPPYANPVTVKKVISGDNISSPRVVPLDGFANSELQELFDHVSHADSSRRLSHGATAGIAVSSVSVVIIALLGLTFWWYRRSGRNSSPGDRPHFPDISRSGVP